MPEQISFIEAHQQALVPLSNSSSMLRLVERAERDGLLGALREPAELGAVAASTGRDMATVRTLCRALWMGGVLEETGGRYQLAPAWAALSDPGAFVPLGVQLDAQRVTDEMMSGTSYWDLPSEDRLLYARSISPNPFSDELVERLRADAQGDPAMAALAGGGRYLELGCGVAGRILTTLRAFEGLTAVGVELSADLVEEARHRAEQLGLGDRFEVINADATTFTDQAGFDFGFWSQFFFPSESRAGALRTMLDCVRPGGTIWAPVFGFHDKMAADPRGPVAQDYVLGRVVLDVWGVPERTDQELVDEIAAAGFVEVRIIERSGGFPAVQATRP